VEDLELLLDVLAGPVVDEAVAWRLNLPPSRSNDLAELRIGLWLDDPKASVDTEVGDVLQGAVDAFVAAGACVINDRPPLDIEDVMGLAALLIGAAASVSRDLALMEQFMLDHRRWLDLTIERNRVRSVWRDWFSRYDVLLCPVMPMAAIAHDTALPFMERTTLINGEPRSHLACATWTGLIGVAYLPSTVIPVGLTRSGLPVGMQVVGPYLEDRTSLAAGRFLASVLGPWQAPPLATEP